jgi:hypothetical protein
MFDDAVRDIDPVGERGLEAGELDPVVDLQHQQPAISAPTAAAASIDSLVISGVGSHGRLCAPSATLVRHSSPVR